MLVLLQLRDYARSIVSRREAILNRLQEQISQLKEESTSGTNRNGQENE